jgi:hypothetical protein
MRYGERHIPTWVNDGWYPDRDTSRSFGLFPRGEFGSGVNDYGMWIGAIDHGTNGTVSRHLCQNSIPTNGDRVVHDGYGDGRQFGYRR